MMEDSAELETKFRKIVMNLIEPTIRRMTEQSIIVEQHEKATELLRRRADTHDVMIDRVNSKLTLVEEFSRKLMQFEAELRITEMNFEKEIQKVLDLVNVVSGRVSNCEENIEVLKGQTQTLKTDLIALNQETNGSKTVLTEKISVFKAETENNFKMSSEKSKIIEVNIGNLGKKIEITREELQETDAVVKQVRIDAANALDGLGKLVSRVEIDKKDVKMAVEKIRMLTIQYNHQSTQQIKALKGQIWKEIPVNTHFQITELLYKSFADIVTSKKIAEAEVQTLKDLETEGLTGTLMEKYEAAKQRNEEITAAPVPKAPARKRTKLPFARMMKQEKGKEISQKKPENINSITESISNITETHIISEQPEKRIEYTLEDSDHSDNSDSEDSSFDLEFLKSNPEMLSKLLGIKDYSSEIESLRQTIDYNFESFQSFSTEILESHLSLKSKFTTEFASFQSFCLTNIESISNSLTKLENSLVLQSSKQIEDHSFLMSSLEVFRSSLHELIAKLNQEFYLYIEKNAKTIDTIEVQVTQAVYECNSASAQRRRDHNDNYSEFQKLHNVAEGILKQQDLFLNNFDRVHRSLNLLTEFAKITSSLQGQDETDREAIALYGYKDSRHGRTRGGSMNKTSISLDKQCISCSGQVNMITSAFKIACLAYTPSPVQFKGMSYPRAELLEMQRNIFEGVAPDPVLQDVSYDRIRLTKTPKPAWRPQSSLSMCVPSALANTPDLPPISLSKRINNY